MSQLLHARLVCTSSTRRRPLSLCSGKRPKSMTGSRVSFRAAYRRVCGETLRVILGENKCVNWIYFCVELELYVFPCRLQPVVQMGARSLGDGAPPSRRHGAHPRGAALRDGVHRAARCVRQHRGAGRGRHRQNERLRYDSFNPNVCLSVCPSVCLSFCLSVWLFIFSCSRFLLC